MPGVLVLVEQHHAVAVPQVGADLREGGCQPRGGCHLQAEVHHLSRAHPLMQRIEERYQLGTLGLGGQQPQQRLVGTTVAL